MTILALDIHYDLKSPIITILRLPKHYTLKLVFLATLVLNGYYTQKFLLDINQNTDRHCISQLKTFLSIVIF